MFDVYQRDYGHVQGSFNLQSQVIWDIFLKFQKDHGISGHMFEIGVQFGKSAILSALHAHPNEALVYCDLYLREDAQAHVSQVAGPGAAFLRKSSAAISVERELIQEEKGYRWIHIDGNHSAQFVYNDLVIADRILDETGIVVLDDFFSVQYPQVTEAFYSYIRAQPHAFQPIMIGFNKGYLARPLFARRYLEFIKEEFHDRYLSYEVGDVRIFKTSAPDDCNTFGIAPPHEGKAGYQGPDWSPETIEI